MLALPAFADEPCKNLVPLRSSSYFTLGENNTLSNAITDTRTDFNFNVMVRLNSGSYVVVAWQAITSPGKYNFSFTVPDDAGNSYFLAKHNGMKSDIIFLFDLWQILSPGETYTMSFDVLSADPTTVGGIQLKDIQIERGSTATTYQPYNPLCATCDGTVVVENGESHCVEIKIATTAYNAAAFAPVEEALENAVTTIKDVVANTIVQADAIQNLQDTKQTMPDASGTNGTCPRFRQCLLIETASGTPQWFQIADPVHDLVLSLKNNKVNSSGENTSTAFAANGYDGTNNTTDSRYYKGYPEMRLKSAAQSSSVYTRQFSSTLLNGTNGGQYKTLGDQEWAVTWDGDETGTQNSFLPGVIYGTSRCVKASEAPTTTYAAKVNPGTAGWTLVENSDALNDLENIDSYVKCYCKMIGVGLDGMITPVRDSSAVPWVFNNMPGNGSGGDCAYSCAFDCANNFRANASFRQAVMGWAIQ